MTYLYIKKISDALKNTSDETEYFWNEVFHKYNGSIIRSKMFSTDENRYKAIRRINTYLKNSDTYNELRNKFDKTHISFHQGDIFNDEINGSYDNIFLSNLASYYRLAEIKELFDKMLSNLNDNGKIMLAYLYGTDLYSDDYMDGEAEIYNIPKVLKTFPENIKFNSFMGVRGLFRESDRLRDSIITYRKVKKMQKTC